MSEPRTPAPDLFDESPLHHPAAHIHAIAPMTPKGTWDEPDEHTALRWWPAGVSLGVAAAVGFIFHFPPWALASQPLFWGAINLRPLPPLTTRACRYAAVSFFFAQATSIFITPFTWPMRFGFCATLLIGLRLVRVNGDE